MESLPSELALEILSRTELESLEECKSVCKDWREVMKEPSFIHLHSERHHSISGYFVQGLGWRHPWAFVPATASYAFIKRTWPRDRIEIRASCDQGILICERQVDHLPDRRLYACKPATGQWQALPNPKFRYGTDSFAVVVLHSQPPALRYLIARLYASETQTHCEMFDSQVWRWQKMDCCVPDHVVGDDQLPVTTAGRFVHWLAHSGKVVTLDVEKRRFETLELPEKVRCDEMRLVEYEGGLRLMCRSRFSKEIELWDIREEERTLLVHINAANLAHPTVVHFCNSNLAFMTTMDDEGAAFYNLSNSTVAKVELPCHVKYPCKFDQRIFPFKSDIKDVHLKPISLW